MLQPANARARVIVKAMHIRFNEKTDGGQRTYHSSNAVSLDILSLIFVLFNGTWFQ